MAGPKGQALLRAVKTELEAEGGVLRTTDEYVDALINYKIRRLVRKHALAASALAGTGASGAALLGLLLQALARLSRAGPGRTTTSAPPDRPPLKARPPGASEEEEAARRSSAPYGGGAVASEEKFTLFMEQGVSKQQHFLKRKTMYRSSLRLVIKFL